MDRYDELMKIVDDADVDYVKFLDGGKMVEVTYTDGSIGLLLPDHSYGWRFAGGQNEIPGYSHAAGYHD